MPGVEAMITQCEKMLGVSGRPNEATRWYAGRNGSYYASAAWCDEFITWAAFMSGNYDAVCAGTDFAYTVSHAQKFKDKGQWNTDTAGIRRGDILFFDWDGSNSISAIDHVGIVTGVNGRDVLTIEGNTSDSCARRVRNADSIVGYGRPAYVGTTPPPVPVPGAKPKVKLSDAVAKTAAATTIIQTALNAEYGAVAIDGDYGPQTAAAYTRWQQYLGWPGDGLPGAHSLSELGKKRGFDVDLEGAVATPPGGGTTPPPTTPPPVTPPAGGTVVAVDATAVLAALAKLPSTVVGGKYATDTESTANIDIKKTSTGAYWWKADMDIDTDGQAFPEQDNNSDRQTDTSFHQTDGKPLNSGKLPFIVIPLPSAKFSYSTAGIKGGDSALVIYNGKMVYAVFGDEGPTTIIGEASYAAAKALGVQGIPYGGVDSASVTYVVFPGNPVKPIESIAAVNARGKANADALVAAAGGVVTPPPVTPPTGTDTLRGAGAAKGITMGAAVADSLLGNSQAIDVLKREYGCVTAENVMKWGNIHPQRDTFNWTAADRLVNFAGANGQKVHGHTLLWHTEMPSWAGEADLEPHIRAVVGRYKGKVHSWDVVNEVMGDDAKLRDVWYKLKIADAFRIAHEVDPDAILYLNDYNIEDGRPKSDAVYELVKSLLAAGVPIHGVGFQCHFHTGWTPSPALEVQMKRFAALGLRVSITEFDCAIKDGGTTATQATHYGNMIKAALAVGPKFDKFTTWGFTDASTWLAGQKPLPFDTAYAKKPAYTAMLNALKGATAPPVVVPPVVTPPIVSGTVVFEDCGPGGTIAANKVVQAALNKFKPPVTVDGDWGPQTTAAYQAWQVSVGYNVADGSADGLPGIDSMTKLSVKYGFTVTRRAPTTPPPTTPPPTGGYAEADYATVPEPAGDYTRTTYGGETVNRRTAAMLALASKWAGLTFRLTQGSYSSGVPASAGTHDGGGAGDLDVSAWSTATRNRVVQCMRKAGFAAWYRTPDQGDWGAHIHFEAIGDREMSSGGKSQVQNYFDGDNGLVGNARTEGETHWPNWADRYRT
ncbi:endo-1,4-beta-xylanase [Streptomyces sp. NPDC058471]|uniref:endo-1,4-beta-xylanase n=1 Tax=Streptomyces sp. NPDC058471 TaxID=3346516 RepID=UPI00365D453C